MDVSILAEELLFPESLQELVFPNSRCQACHINEVLLDDSDADEVLAVLFFSLPFLDFLLSLFGSSLLLVLLYVGSELRDSVFRSY